MNLYHYLSNSVFRYPDKTAVKYNGQGYSYLELDERVNRLANALSGLGIKKGGKVALICHNSNAYMEIFFAAAKLGAATEHFNWRLHPATALDLAEKSDASIIFVSWQNIELYRTLKQGLTRPVTFIGVGGSGFAQLSYEELLSAHQPNSETADCASDDLALLLYTSGTTGVPKGVGHSNFSFLIHALVGIAEFNWHSRNVFLSVLPLFHASASGAYNTLFTGGTLIIADKFEPAGYLRLIQDERVTIIGQIPHMIEWLLNTPQVDEADLSSLDMIIYSGAPMASDTLRRAMDVFRCGFLQIYGMTELAPNVAYLTPQEHAELMRTDAGAQLPVGKPLMGARVKIIDSEGRSCQPGKRGEILAAGDTLMMGYYGQPELTAEVIRNGWYHTGDVGYLDDRGYLYVIGRKKHMIISGGENIFPSEVENAIRAIGDAIADVAVIGVPSKRWGEVVKALVQKQPDSELSEEQILDYCAGRLDPYKKPRIVQFVSKIARNESGKPLYDELKSRYSTGGGYIDRRFL